MSDRESNIKTVLFLVIGILLLLSLVVCIFIVGQESEYVQTEAYVAEITKDAGGSGKNSVILNYDVGGTTYGYTYETKEDLNTNQKVTIFYDKKTPKYATVEKTSKIIFLFPVAGLVLCVAGLYQLFKNRGKSEDGEEQFKTSVINVVGNTQQLEIVADETEAQEYEKTHEEEIESDVKPIIKPETPIVDVELPKEAPVVEKVEVETEAPVTEPVTEVVTEPITEAPTQPVTEPVTEAVTEPVTSAPVPVAPVTEAPKEADPVADAIVKKVQENVSNDDGKVSLDEDDIKKVIKDVLKEVIQEVQVEKTAPKKVVQRRVLPNYYYISGTSLIYEEPGKEAKEMSLKTVKSVVRTVNSEGNVVKLIVSNEEVKCILTNMKNIDLEQVAGLLKNKMCLIDENFKEVIEYKEY